MNERANMTNTADRNLDDREARTRDLFTLPGQHERGPAYIESPFAIRCRLAANGDPLAATAVKDAVAALIASGDGELANECQVPAGRRVLHCYLASRVATPDGLSGLLGLPGIDVNAGETYYTPLMTVLGADNRDNLAWAADLLVRAGVRLDGHRDSGYYSPLTTTLRRGYYDVAKLMFDLGAQPDDNGTLSVCINRYAESQVCKDLLPGLLAAAEPDIRRAFLYLVLKEKQADEEVIMALLAGQATPLCAADMTQHPDIVLPGGEWFTKPRAVALEQAFNSLDWLVRQGISPDILTGYLADLYMPNKDARSSRFEPNSVDRRALTSRLINDLGARPCEGLLWQACKAKAPAADLALLAEHAREQLNTPGPDGYTPLAALCRHHEQWQGRPVASRAQVKALLDAGADPNVDSILQPGTRPVSTFTLIQNSCPEHVDLLLDYGADPGHPEAPATPGRAGL